MECFGHPDHAHRVHQGLLSPVLACYSENEVHSVTMGEVAEDRDTSMLYLFQSLPRESNISSHFSA